MTPEEEKRLVLKFLGYTSCDRMANNAIGKENECWVSPNDNHVLLKTYDPFSKYVQRYVWDEIWDKMDNEMWRLYLECLGLVMDTGFPVQFLFAQRMLHTAKPEVRWKALILALQKLQQIKS